jgi:hypothetical protein
MEKQIITLKDKTYEGHVEGNRFIVNGEPLIGVFKQGMKTENDIIKVSVSSSGSVVFEGAEKLKFWPLSKVIVAKKVTSRTKSHTFSQELSPMAQKVFDCITNRYQPVAEVAEKAKITPDQIKGVLSKLSSLELIELKKGKEHGRYVRLIQAEL